jgi:hypothetical protein
MSEEFNTIDITFEDNTKVIVHEYSDHPARKNSNLGNIFCADGWWRIECWTQKDGYPQLFATVIIVRVFDEKNQNKCVLVRERVYLLRIPSDGLYHATFIDRGHGALVIQFLPDEQAKVNFLPIKLPD